MITSYIQGTDEMTYQRWVCSTPSQVIKIPKSPFISGFCECKYICDYFEKAFYYPEDTSDSYKNDYRKLIITLLSDTSTFEFFIVDLQGVETPFNETYGEVYEVGFNIDQPLMTGINVQWEKVGQTLGNGKYKIKTVQTNFGTETTSSTHYFDVMPFTVDDAWNTLKIEPQNEGYTINGNDYKGLGTFVNMVRVYGGVTSYGLKKERSTLLDANEEEIDTQSTNRSIYDVLIKDLPSSIGDQLLEQDTLAPWKISSYNLLHYKIYVDLEVNIESVETVTLEADRRGYFNVSLIDSKGLKNRKYI